MDSLVIDGVSKAFGAKSVLCDIGFRVPAGSLVTILGASGSGKTTLLRLLGGFERLDAGSIRIAGRLVAARGLHLPPERRGIGYVAQEGALFPHLSVADNVVFGLGPAERRRRGRVPELLDLVGLPPDFAARPPHELSGGEQQRVALARALARNPQLVLLDEPFSALDTALRVETRQAVAAALAAAGATAILVTHDQPEALSMGNPVAVLRAGRLVQIASPRQLYRHPTDADLARFIGEAVLVPGLARNGRAFCDLGALKLAPGMPQGPVDILIRPEQIRLVPPGDADGIAAEVRAVTFYGAEARVELVLAETSAITIIARVPGFRAPAPGERIGVAVDGAVAAYGPS
jgi:iron(III) transport system ATP-binding protein